jgi:NAD(P)-dependent dehydrogenase (short-subunit alcohol dehydrogenase family)
MRFSGKVAIITGGGSGIGQAIGELLATEGALVALADRTLERAEVVARGIKDQGGSAIAIHADVREADAVYRMVETARGSLGPVDILVNNAGLSVGADLVAMTPDEWDLNLDVVLRGAFLCSRAVLPGMIERDGGSILNIASVNGLTALGEPAYSAAKAGLINLTQNLAVSYGRHGIRTNVICPGTVRTPIWDARVAEDPDVFDRLAGWYPLGRIGEPGDVARAAAFLLSDDASWITGAVLPVDGGLTAGSFRMATDLSGEQS